MLGGKRQGELRRPACCWKFNEGLCTFGKNCRYPHTCESCGGAHAKVHCGKRMKLT